MRKFLLIVSAILIVTALVGPGLTGMAAEKLIRERHGDLAASLPAGLELVDQRFDRGWFSSQSEYRIVVTGKEAPALVRGLFKSGRFGDEPALVVRSRVQHGPLVNLITPAIGQVHSQLVLDDGAQQRVLPAVLQTRFSLFGNTRLRLSVADGQYGSKDAQGIAWQGFSAEQTVNRRIDYSTVKIVSKSLSMLSAGEPSAVLQDFLVEAKISRDNILLDGDIALSFFNDENPDSPTHVSTDISWQHVPLNSAPHYSLLYQAISAADQLAIENQFVELLRKLLPYASVLRIQQQVAQGDAQSDLAIEIALPQSEPALIIASDQQLLKSVNDEVVISAKLKLHESHFSQLMEHSGNMSKQISMLHATGFLQKTEDSYELDADYAQGLLTVNGMPLALNAPATAE